MHKQIKDEALRDTIGVAIYAMFLSSTEAPDWNDPGAIDRLAEAVMRVLPVTAIHQANAEAGPTATPAAQWREKGEADPHDTRYNCERAALCMGDLSDDELANAAFLNYDRRPSFEDLVAGKGLMPIAYMTAVKDRIRWLSRALVAAGKDAQRYCRLRNVSEAKLGLAGVPCIAMPSGPASGSYFNGDDADRIVDAFIFSQGRLEEIPALEDAVTITMQYKNHTVVDHVQNISSHARPWQSIEWVAGGEWIQIEKAMKEQSS